MNNKPERLNIKRGFSKARDEATAVRQLVQQIDQADADLMVFFASSEYNLKRLGKELKDAFRAPLIGCTTSGEITPEGYADGTLSGFSIASDEVQIDHFLITPLHDFDSNRIEKAASGIQARLSQARKETPEAGVFGLLLIDGLSMMEERIAAILGNALGDVPIVGGSAGDDLKLNKTYVYTNGRFISDAALFTLFYTTLPFAPIKTQHFTATDERLVITRASPEDRVVYQINGRPAAEEYARVIGIEHEQLKHLVYFARPLMLRIGGEYFVRSVQRVNDDGSLTFFSAIDEGLVLRVAERQNLVKNLESALSHIGEEISNIKLTIGCDCILRRLEVKDKALDEQVNKIMKHYHVIGFNTYGEQYNSLHINQTFTGIVLGE